jgi:hypothetical protein
MKMIYALLLAAALSTAAPARTLVDSIVGVVGNTIVTHSDLERPQITKNLKPFTFDERATQLLWLERAKARQMEPAQEDVERSVVAYKQENGLAGLADDEVDRILLDQIGLDLASYRAQLTDHYMVESLKNYEYRSRCSVSESEITAYYERHPEVTPASYKIELALLTPQQKASIATNPASADGLLWDQFDWIAHDDVAAHLHCVYSLPLNTLSSIIAHNGQEFVVRVVEKKEAYTLQLSERYASIERLLQHRKMAALDMDSEVRQGAVIVQY